MPDSVKSYLIISILVLAMASAPLPAKEPRLSAGFKSGANVSWVTGEAWQEDLVESLQGDNAPRFGPTLGAFVSVVFPSGFGGRAELLFAEHGGKVINVVDSDAEFDARFSLLDISILIERRFRLGPGDFSIYLGPTLFLVQGDLVIESDFGGGSSEERDAPEEDQFFAARDRKSTRLNSSHYS